MSEDLREERKDEDEDAGHSGVDEGSALDELLGAEETGDEPDGDDAELKCIVEALLFSSDRPVTTRRLAEMSGAKDGRQVRRLLRELARDYNEQGRAFSVEEIAGGFQLLTRPEYSPWISRLQSRQQSDSLSKAALETLAIVAYRQPITRAEVDDIRGVQCGPLLRALVDRRLIKVVGRSEELGRPLLYGTTKRFLEVFGLKSLSELPKRSEFTAIRPQPTAEEHPAEAEPAPREGAAADGDPTE